MPKFLFRLFLQLEMLTFGATLVAMFLLVRNRPFRWWTYFTTKVGILITNGVLLKAVIPAQVVQPTAEAYVFMVGLVFTCLGLVGVSSAIARKAAEHKGPLGFPDSTVKERE